VGIVCGAIVAMQILALARAFGAPFWAAVGASITWIIGRRTSAYGVDGLSDMLFLMLFAQAMLVAIRATRIRRSHLDARQEFQFALAGFLSGLAYLTRPEGLAATGIVGLVLLLMLISGRRMSSRGMKLFRYRAAPRAAVTSAIGWLIVGVAIPALPYMILIGGITHKKSIDIVGGGTISGQHAIASMMPLGAISWSLVTKMAMELWETFGFGPWLALMGAMLLAPHFWGRARLRLLVVVWIVIWGMLMIWLLNHAGYLDGRHTLPLELVLHGPLALAFVIWMRPMRWWMDWWRAKPAWNQLPPWMRWHQWPYAFAGGAIVLTLLPGLIRLATPPQQNQEYMREAAAWVSANTRPNVVICDQQRLVGYYSGHPYKQWSGSLSKPLLQQVAMPQPHIIAYVFRPNTGEPSGWSERPGLGEVPQLAIGPYRAIASFRSATASHGDILVLYALPNTSVMSHGEVEPLATLPAH